jgi:type I restriction enzyme S subunit
VKSRSVRLEEVCEINPRAPKGIADQTDVTFVPMSAVSEDGYVTFEETRTYGDVKKGYTYFERGDVLVAKITPCFENGKAASTETIRNKLGFGSTEFHVLRPSPELHAKYAFYLLWSDHFRRIGEKGMTGSAGQKRVPADLLRRLEIPLPPLDEQKRIAAILDKADQLRQKRRQAIALLDSLTQSIFLEMFGSWTETRKLTEVASIKSGSTPSRNEADNFGGPIPWVKTTEVKGQTIDLTEETVTEKGVRAARLKLFAPDTVLMAMYGQGTTRGKVAILGVPATINQACAAIRPNDGLDAVFLFHQLRLKYDEIRSLGRGGNQPNLNLELVGSIDVKMPPLTDQLKFKRLIETITESAKRHNASANNCETLFVSLQGRAFAGKL